jgi:hypothetical protein
MTEGKEAALRQVRAPLRQRSRRRWAVAGGVAACWVVLEVVTGSAVSATVVLVAIAGLGAASIGGLRALGVTRNHPWLRQLASRPWRDGQDVLKVAIRHLPDVFVVTPSGLLLAPNVVDLQLNPSDLVSLCGQMELGVISSSVTEVYAEQVAAHGARFAGPGRADVRVIAAGSVPPGRYRLRQCSPGQGDPGQYSPGKGNPASASAEPDRSDVWYADVPPEFEYVASPYAYASPGHVVGPEPDSRLTVAGGMATVMERNLPSVPTLRLVTGSSVAETTMSGARAGRGPVELVLPDVPTVSREHARFTFSDGRWWITNQGRNGLTLNGAAVAGEQPLSDGDAIRWGTRTDALRSRVEIS